MQSFSRSWQKIAASISCSKNVRIYLYIACLMLCLMMVGNVTEAASADGVEEGHVYIPAGTCVPVRLEKEVSAADVREGDAVPVVLLGDLRINGVPVIRSKTAARAVVSKSRHAGVYGRSGLLVIDIQSVRTANGILVPLKSENKKRVADHDNALTKGILGGLFIKGAQAVYKKGSFFTAVVEKNVDLGVSREALAEAMHMTAASADAAQ